MSIDSLFHHQVLSQIQGYPSAFSNTRTNYFISKQHNISGPTALTISLYWDLCYEGIFLLILDNENKLLNSIDLTEWNSGCESPSTTDTYFLTDSTFVQHVTRTEPGEETDLITEIEFRGHITSAGELDTLDLVQHEHYTE